MYADMTLSQNWYFLKKTPTKQKTNQSTKTKKNPLYPAEDKNASNV